MYKNITHASNSLEPPYIPIIVHTNVQRRLCWGTQSLRMCHWYVWKQTTGFELKICPICHLKIVKPIFANCANAWNDFRNISQISRWFARGTDERPTRAYRCDYDDNEQRGWTGVWLPFNGRISGTLFLVARMQYHLRNPGLKGKTLCVLERRKESLFP